MEFYWQSGGSVLKTDFDAEAEDNKVFHVPIIKTEHAIKRRIP